MNSVIGGEEATNSGICDIGQSGRAPPSARAGLQYVRVRYFIISGPDGIRASLSNLGEVCHYLVAQLMVDIKEVDCGYLYH